MTYLKYYKKENQDFPDYTTTYLNQLETRGLCQLVTQELKLKPLTIKFRNGLKTIGIYHENKNQITYPNQEKHKVLSIAHELAHHLDVHRNGTYKGRKAHTKKHRTCLKMILKLYDKTQ